MTFVSGGKFGSKKEDVWRKIQETLVLKLVGRCHTVLEFCKVRLRHSVRTGAACRLNKI